MLTILKDPAGITGLSNHEWDYSKTIFENILTHHPHGGADCEVIINGQKIDPLTDVRLLAPPCDSDRVILSLRPAGLDPVSWIVIAAVAFGAVAITYALMPKINSEAGRATNDSPNNRLTAQTNIARAYQGIPDVYGTRRVWPDLIQPSTVEYIDNIKYVTEWMCVTRGKATITDVQYAETPIDDIDGSSYEIFEPSGSFGYPEFQDTTLTNVVETFASDEVNGQDLPYATVYPAIESFGDLNSTVGDNTFTITLPDSPALDMLKGLSPTGLAQVSFTYTDSLSSPANFNESCIVLSYLVSAGECIFTFQSSFVWDFTTTQTSLDIDIVPNGFNTVLIGPFTLPIPGSSIRWNTVFLRGLKGATYSGGFLVIDKRVKIKAEWWQIDDDGVEISGTRESRTDIYTDDTYDQRFFTEQATPSAGYGRYRIQFSRVSLQSDDNGADFAKLDELYAVRVYEEKVLPGVTVIRVTTKATTDATGFSDRKFNLRMSRHVRTLGFTLLSASSNFARIMAHIWVLSGNEIEGLDVDTLEAINTEFGETNPLLQFSASLDDADMSLGERLQLVANHARCVVWRDGQKWTVTRDQARQYPEIQFDYRNLAQSGDSTISYAAHLPASNDGVEVEYVDPVSQSKKSYFRLDINSGVALPGPSGNPLKIKLIGCTSLEQAENRAYLEANRLIYQRVSVSDTALCDYQSIGLGSLVRWIDPADFAGDDGLQAGEVIAISGSVIATSEKLDFKGESTGRILFTGSEGQRLGAPVVCSPLEGNSILLASVPSGIYVKSSTRQLGSRYAFTVGLTESETENSGLYTVTEIRPNQNGTASVALAAYDERIYSED